MLNPQLLVLTDFNKLSSWIGINLALITFPFILSSSLSLVKRSMSQHDAANTLFISGRFVLRVDVWCSLLPPVSSTRAFDLCCSSRTTTNLLTASLIIHLLTLYLGCQPSLCEFLISFYWIQKHQHEVHERLVRASSWTRQNLTDAFSVVSPLRWHYTKNISMIL